ncbi:CHAT domain-containing protein [Myxococcaceae bacterium GXIMD 01537]
MPGNMDLFCLADGDRVRQATTFGALAAVLQAPKAPDWPSGVHIIAPSLSTPEEELAEFWTQMEELARKHSGTPDAQSQLLTVFRRRVRPHFPQERDTESLLERLRAIPSGAIVLIQGLARFSSVAVGREQALVVGPSPFEDSFHLSLHEDVWVPQVHHAAEHLVDVARERQLYILAMTGQPPPVREKNVQQLMSIDDCGLLMEPAVPGTAQIVKHLPHWIGLIRQQRAADAFLEIDQSELSPYNKAWTKAICLVGAGQSPLALRLLLPFRERLLEKRDAHHLVTVARMARDAGQRAEASVFLKASREAPNQDEHSLGAALQLAESLDEVELAENLFVELARQYPGSDPVIHRTIKRLLSQRRFDEAAERLAPRVQAGTASSQVRYLLLLSQTLGQKPEPDYSAFIERVATEGVTSPTVAVVDSARSLLDRGLPLRAIQLLTGRERESASEDVADMMLRLLNQVLIAPAPLPEGWREGLDSALEWVTRYLGTHPADGEVRVRFTRLLAPEAAGSRGVIRLAELALTQDKGILVSDLGALTSERNVPLDGPFIKGLFKRIEGAFSLDTGKVNLQGLPYTAVDLFVAIRSLVQHDAPRAGHDVPVETFQAILHLGLALARQTGHAEAPFDLMKMACASLCMSGNVQLARDLAETGLHLPEDASPLQKRSAWLLFADVYNRARNIPEALLGLTCARFHSEVIVSAEHAYHEACLLARILRDMKLPKQALEAVTRARELMREFGQDDTQHLQINTLEAGIEFLRLHEEEPEDLHAAMEALSTRLVSLTEQARKSMDDLWPVAALLAQQLAQSELLDLPMAPAVRSAFEECASALPPSQKSQLEALAGSARDTESLEQVGHQLRRARYAEDLGYDLQHPRVLARNILTKLSNLEARRALYALEWLADHSLRNVDEVESAHSEEAATGETEATSQMLGWIQRSLKEVSHEDAAEFSRLNQRNQEHLTRAAEARQPRVLGLPEEVCAFAVQLNQRGLDVHLFGFDSLRGLAHASAVEGKISAHAEPPEVFSRMAHARWREQYPFAYGRMDPGDPRGFQQVESSMRQLGLTLPERQAPLLLVSDSELQGLPVNLLLGAEEFLGLQRPVATTPALSWLQACHVTPRRTTGRKVAWVSRATEGTDQAESVLQYLAHATSGVLRDAGFAVSHEPNPPEGLEGADVAVIGAHGSLDDEGFFFRAVVDEGSTRLSARGLAQRAQGAGVVILFMCSGGRVNSNPFSSATVGLPRLLLDHGCRAVIASPWNLYAPVATIWLPAFLQHFDAGLSLIEANYQANRAVRSTLSTHPALQLAMHVFGDPLFKKAA